jgi:hypothetical protein
MSIQTRVRILTSHKKRTRESNAHRIDAGEIEHRPFPATVRHCAQRGVYMTIATPNRKQ